MNLVNYNFCLGSSKPFNIFNKKDLEIIKFALFNNFFFHISITYPVNALILKYFFKKTNVKVIAKLLGGEGKIFKLTLKETLKRFGLKRIHIAQIVCLPTRNFESNSDSFKIQEYYFLIQKLQESKKFINKVYLQIFSTDTLTFIKKVYKDFDGFIFYANFKEIFIQKDVYLFINENKIPVSIISVFGGGNLKNEANLTIKTLSFINKNFPNGCIPIGRTQDINRLINIKKIIDGQLFDNSLTSNFKFNNNYYTEEDSNKFIKEIRVSGYYYSLKHFLKCALRSIFQ